MISGISSPSTPIASVSMVHSKQIVALFSQVGKLEGQIAQLEERIFQLNENPRLTNEERLSNISNVNEQIGRIRERIREVHLRISEARVRQAQAEREARARQQAAAERVEQTRPLREEDAEAVVDGSLVHAIIGAEQVRDETGDARAQISARQRTARQENIWRVTRSSGPDDEQGGRMVLIPLENRRPRDPIQAQSTGSRLDMVNRNVLREGADRSTAFAAAGERTSQAEGWSEAYEKEQGGSGRREPGQYLEDRA